MTTLTINGQLPLASAHAAHGMRVPCGAEARPAGLVCRPFYLAALAAVLTAGASWGAYLLWQIGFAGKFTGVPVHHVNAHGHVQVMGWVGLFIIGSAYLLLPRVWRVPLAAPWLSGAVLALVVTGMAGHATGMALSGQANWALSLAMAGGAMELAGIALFVTQLLVTYRSARLRPEPYVGFVFGALLWLVAMTAMSVWHTYHIMTAPDRDTLIWYVATYQAPLRDLQVHGLALFMILGVSLRMLPTLFGFPSTPCRRAWIALALLTAAVVGETVWFIIYRFSGKHALAALLMVPWLMLAAGVLVLVLPWRLWKSPATADRSAKFVRTAYLWLGISLAMLLLLPVYQAVSGIPFSHAYYGAIRHAITVGFVSLMIVGMSSRLVPTMRGMDTFRLPSLLGPFILINIGCTLRVTLQIGTDWHPAFFHVVGISGLLEVAGLAWWAGHLVRLMQAERPSAALDVARA